MKKLFSWITLLVGTIVSVAISSCGPEPAPPVSLQLSGSKIIVEASGVSANDVIVTAVNTDWSVSVVGNGREWLSAYKNGNRVTVTARENTSPNEREAIIIVTATSNASLSYQIRVVQKPTAPYITVNGSPEAFPDPFPGAFGANKTGVDYKLQIKVKSNVQWTLNGNVNWLNISTTSGNGEVDLYIYPTTEYDSDTEREATLTLSGSGASATIHVVQQGSRPVCTVTPINEVALYNSISYELKATSNVDKFKVMLIRESALSSMTDMEIMSEFNTLEPLEYSDDWLFFPGKDFYGNDIVPTTAYYIVTIAYDQYNQTGSIKKKRIVTPAYLDEDHDAWVRFENVACNSSGFWFDAIKDGYASTYHLIYGISDELRYSVVYAFQINYFVKYNKKHWLAENWDMQIVTNYPATSHTFTYPTSYLSYYPICFAYGWGIFQNGNLSSDLVGFEWDTSVEEAMGINGRRNARGNAVAPKDAKIKRSVEMQRAKALRK